MKKAKIIVTCFFTFFFFAHLVYLNKLPEAYAMLTGNDFIEEIATAPATTFLVERDSQGRLFALAGNDIYRSTDEGVTWMKVGDFNNFNASFLLLYIDSRDYIFASVYIFGQGWLLKRSVDHGSSWSTVLSGYSALWEMDEASNGSLYLNNYVGTTPNEGNDFVLRSDDGGATWIETYNVSGIDHIHCVAVDDYTDEVYIATGDGQYQSTLQRYNSSTGNWDILSNDTKTILQYETTQITFDSDYVYFWHNAQMQSYRMKKSGTSTSDFEIVFQGFYFKDVGDSNFVYEAVRIGDVYLFGTDEGQLWGSWDGEHWVKLFDMGTDTVIRSITRQSYPFYFTITQNSPYDGTLYRLSITKEDLVRLYYGEYNLRRGSLTNAQNYILEQRIHNETNYIDLTSVALSNVQASIKGLSRTNQILAPANTPNAGWEWNNKTGWAVNEGAGTFGTATVTSEDKANGTYSLKYEKDSGDSYDAVFTEPVGDYTTLNRGDILLVSCYIKGNVSSSERVRMGWKNDTGSMLQYTNYFDLTTSWQHISGFYQPYRATNLPVNIRVELYVKKGITCAAYWDSVLLQKLEFGIAYNNGASNEEIGYFENLSPVDFHTSELKTTNPTLTINGETISHSGTLNNGSESSATSLSGILTGAVKVDANIGGSGQTILKITGTRIVHVTNAVLQARKDSVYYGRYYATPTINASDLVALTSKQANITALSYANNKLTLTIDAPSNVTSTTKVYTGDKGQPISVAGATTWDWNETSKILDIIGIHSSQITITVTWRFPGDINGDGIVNVLDLYGLSKAYGATLTDPNWDEDADINSDNIIDTLDLSIIGENYGKTSN